jgi:putative pre-16S rRNA nuclease
VTRLIGLDHGSRRIGVAVADSETGVAFARPAIRLPRRGTDLRSGARAVVALAAAEGTGLVILGLPRNMNGSEGPQAAAARAFGNALVAEGLEVRYVDERLTSWEAGQEPAPRDRRARESGALDSAAARLILQDYLDARRSAPPGAEAGSAGGAERETR